MHIYDIRRSSKAHMDLRAEIVAGMQRKDKYLPSLLLWDDRGHEIFEEILSCREYYPFRAELDLLRENGDDIAECIKPNSIIIELGAGNCQKTLFILAALEARHKPVIYFALDVAEDGLRKSLSGMLEQLVTCQYVTCHGLLGTYEDCAELLNGNGVQSSRPTMFLWLGNSIANLTKEVASHLLQNLLHRKGSNIEMLVSIDGCHDSESIASAYDLPGQKSREFVQNGLKNANQVLGNIVFQKNDWDFAGVWEAEVGEHRSYHVAKKAMLLRIDGKDVSIVEGEKLLAITSAKWNFADVTSLCESANLRLSRRWIEGTKHFGTRAFLRP